MNIPNLKYYNNKRKIKKINLTSNNNTPQKFSYSNPFSSKQTKIKCRNIKDLSDINISNISYNNIKDHTHKYIFQNYKISQLIALLIYEKAINKLFGFIKKILPKKIFIELKKKYILFVAEELHISNENILSNISEKDLIETNIKLFISQKNSHFLNYRKFIDRYQIKLNNFSNSSSFQINKIQVKRRKISSFNSFNTEIKTNNKSLINSSKIFIKPKNKMKNVCNTEYNIKNLKQKLKPKKHSLKEISKFNAIKIKKNDKTTLLKNIYSATPLNFSIKENKKKFEQKEKIINKENNIGKIFLKLPIDKMKKRAKEKIKEEVKEEKKENDNKMMDIKDNEKYSITQLNLIKEKLEDNLKNMFNFSYGNFLNNERESDSSKSLHDLYRFNYIDDNNHKQNQN